MRYGLIGWPLGHSISPQLHRRLAGVEYDLRPLPEAEFERFMRERDFSAVNVTIPYKRQVLPYCAQLTPAAQCCGSVNLLIKGRDGTLTGDNTDLAGLEFLLRRNGWALTGQTVVILGSGGTGHTAKAAAKELGAAEIATVSRTGELNYENLAKRFGKRDFYLINTTPVGMAPQSGVSPLDLRQFSRCKGVADVIYNPLRTRLCQQAAELGIPACGGLLMLAAQAAAAEYAFGTAVPGEETVLRVYRELLAERRNLVFIGMPGSGKTTIGRLAAQMLEREHPGGGAAGPRGALFPGAGGSAAPEAFAQNRLCDRCRGRGHPAGGKCGGPAGKRPAVLAAAAAGAAAHRGAAAFHRPAGAVPAAGAAVPGCGGF